MSARDQLRAAVTDLRNRLDRAELAGQVELHLDLGLVELLTGAMEILDGEWDSW